MKMPGPGENSHARTHPNGVEPLPLFRPEALAHQQQKYYGQIVLLRPLPLLLVTWIAVGAVAVALALLILGRYTETIRLHGSLVPATVAARDVRAELYVPNRWLARVQPGAQLSLRCPDCSSTVSHPATVLEISNIPLVSTAVSAIAPFEPKYVVTVSLSPQAAQILERSHPPQTGIRVEADIPLGRKPLIQWFFERSGS